MHSHIAQWTCNPLFFSLALPRLDTTVTDREPFRFSIKFMASKSHERLPHVPAPAPAPLPRQLMTGNWQRGKGGKGGNGATGNVHFGVKDENRLDSNLLISFISVLCWLSFVCCLCLNPGYTHVYVSVCVRVCVCLKFAGLLAVFARDMEIAVELRSQMPPPLSCCSPLSSFKRLQSKLGQHNNMAARHTHTLPHNYSQ